MMGLAGSRTPQLADASDILSWAERMTARSELARLIRSLIDQTNDQVVRLEMRAGEGAEVRRQEDKTRGIPKDGRTSLPNVVIAEMRRPDNVNTAIPLAWYRPVWGSRT
jgi:hypothetical protein